MFLKIWKKPTISSEKTKGFTLFEVLIGILLFAIFAGAIAIAINSYFPVKKEQERLKILYEANGLLEYLRGLDFNNICLNGSHNCINDTCCQFYKGSFLRYEVQNLSPHLKKIRVFSNNISINISISVLKSKIY